MVRTALEAGEVVAETSSSVEKPTLAELRRRAFEAVQATQSGAFKEARQVLYKRSRAVREYVIRRANGYCELTGEPAPFRAKSGEPYLEVHHTRRLSDDGPDDPRWVAAITPTAHREIHYGENGDELNRVLREKLKSIEEQ